MPPTDVLAATVAVPVTSADLVHAAATWRDAGFAVVPTAPDGSKRPAGSWKEYQDELMPERVLADMLAQSKRAGLGVVTGHVSGNLELLEIEGPAQDAQRRLAAIAQRAQDYGHDVEALWARLLAGCTEESAGGGLHVFYRLSDCQVPGNTKLAHEDGKVVAETRGQGGFVVVAPTPGRNGHPEGSAYRLLGSPQATPTISREERDIVHLLIQDALETAAPSKPTTPSKPTALALRESSSTSPLDDFRSQVSWREILEPQGWTFSHHADGRDHWTRPGKKVSEGTSATTIEDGPLYCFSSNAGLPTEQGLSKGQVFAHLHHGGDLSAATTALRASGFGQDTLREFVADVPGIEDAVFTASPELSYIRALARERMVSPWALLGTMTALAIAATSPEVRVPAFLASKASLNFGVVLASSSGGGKSAAMQVAREELGEAMQRYGVDERNPSSGEGIVTLFVDTDSKGEQQMLRTRCVSMIDEIGTLAAQASRSGSTLMSVLRTAITGGSLGSFAAEKSRRRHLDPHTYRLCMAVGVQPSTAHHFLGDDGAGTPQRFLWMPAQDQVADAHAPQAGPSPFTTWALAQHGPDITYPDGVREQVRQAHAARLRGEGHALDGHAMLTRLKVAAGLALLHRSTIVTAELWRVSGDIMSKSDLTRERLLEHASEQQKAAAIQRGRNAALTDEAKTQAQMERCVLVIARKVAGSSKPVTRRELKDAAGRYRPIWREALALAIERRYVQAVEVEGTGQSGYHYTPGEVTP